MVSKCKQWKQWERVVSRSVRVYVCVSVVARISMRFKHITSMDRDWIYTDETRVLKGAAMILWCCCCGGVVMLKKMRLTFAIQMDR